LYYSHLEKNKKRRTNVSVKIIGWTYGVGKGKNKQGGLSLSYELFHICRSYIGRSVLITCTDGKKYHGVLKHVDDQKVYVLPYRDSVYVEDRFFVPVLVGLTLGAIAGFALAPRPRPYVYPPPPPYPIYPPYPY
jgi:hypothetical protein